MNIAFIFSQVDSSGPFIVAKDILDVLHLRGHKISIYYLHGEIRQSHAVEPIKISMNETPDLSIFDIIHSHGFRADVFLHLHRRFLKRNTRAVVISTLHQYNAIQTALDYPPFFKAWLMEHIWKISLKSKDVIVGLTRDMAEHYNEYLGRNDCVFIYNGRDAQLGWGCLEQHSAEIRKARGRGYRIIGSAGHLVKRKGFDLLIQTLEVRTDLFLIILGSGHEEENLRQLARTLGVLDRVLFCGYVKHPSDYFKELDVFVLSSRAEGYSLVIAEAAAVGTPVICSNFSFVRELYTEQEVPVFEIGSVSGILDALKLVLDNRSTYSSAIKSRYDRCYTRACMADNYENLYTSLLSTRTTP